MLTHFVFWICKTMGPMFVIITDNASYHSKEMIECLRVKKDKDRGQVPVSYSPNLNPMEAQWREDKHAVRGQPYTSVKALRGGTRMIRWGGVWCAPPTRAVLGRTRGRESRGL